MNILNRIIVVILLLFLIFISAVGIVNIYADFFTWSDIPSTFLSSEVRTNNYIGTAILAAIFIVSILLIVFEFYRRSPKSAVIRWDSAGKFMVTTDSLSRELDRELMKLDEVNSIKAKTIVKKNGVFEDIYAKIIEGQNLNHLAESVTNTSYNFLTEKMGVNVAKVHFTITGFVPEKESAEISEEDLIIAEVKAALQEEKKEFEEGEKEAE